MTSGVVSTDSRAEKMRLANERAEETRLTNEQVEETRLADERAGEARLTDERPRKVRLANKRAGETRLTDERAEETRLADGQAGGTRLTDEQADFVNKLYRRNVPASAIADITQRMLNGDSMSEDLDGVEAQREYVNVSPPSYYSQDRRFSV